MTAGTGAWRGWPTSPVFGLARRVGRGGSRGGLPRFVEQGLATLLQTPFTPRSMAGCWEAKSSSIGCGAPERTETQSEVPAARRLAGLDTATVLAAVAGYYGITQDRFEDPQQAIEQGCCRLAGPPTDFRHVARAGSGLRPSHPDSVNNLIRRVDRALAPSRLVRTSKGSGDP